MLLLAAVATATAIVLGDAVNLRAGPGTAYEVVAQLSGGAEVEVRGEAFGWLLVRPLGELRAYVSRDLVEPKGDGIAAITRDRVNIRSRAALDATVIGQASRGDLVRLIDAEGDFVTIAAPPDVGVYVHADLVRAVDRATTAAAKRPVPGEAGGPALSEAGGTASEAPASVVQPPAAPPTPAAKVLRAREIYQAELEKADIDAMSFGEAERLFTEALKEAGEESVRGLAAAGLRRVRAARALQDDYRRRLGPLERIVAGDREPCATGSK